MGLQTSEGHLMVLKLSAMEIGEIPLGTEEFFPHVVFKYRKDQSFWHQEKAFCIIHSSMLMDENDLPLSSVPK